MLLNPFKNRLLLAASATAIIAATPIRAQTNTPVAMPDPTPSGMPQQNSTQAPTPGQVTASTAPGASGTTPSNAKGLEEVVVTAQRRSERLQNVPIAVTALSRKTLAVAGATTTDNLKEITPGLNFNTNLGGFGQPRIRGIGTTATGPGIENPTATYIDGVYIASSAGALFSLNDVDQIAVLKGPQGTLFGRNATGGLIQVTTRAPSSTPQGEMQVGYGDYNTFNTNGYVTGPITDTLTGSLAGIYENQGDGFGKNLYNGEPVQTHHTLAGRGKLQWKPNDETKITLEADYSNYISSDPAIRTVNLTILDAPTPGGPRDIDLNVQPYLQSRQWGTGLTAQRDFDGFQLQSITAFRESYFHTIFDADQTPLPGLEINEIQRDQQFSQEFQIQSTTAGPLKWVAGLFYFNSDGRYDPLATTGSFLASPFFPLQQSDAFVNERLNSYAGYAQGTYAIDSATNFTAGLRYTDDNRSIHESTVLTVGGYDLPAETLSEAKTFDKLTWRFALDHRFSPDLLAYISYNRGFKSGSFAPDTTPITTLKPETLDAYEAGFKSDLLDHRIRLNVAAFYYNQTNLQVNQIDEGVLLVYNASGAITYGLDADFQAHVTDGLTFTGGVSALHDRYKSFLNAFELFPLPYGGDSFSSNGNATGNRLQNTPDWTLNLGATYDIPTSIGTFTLAANYYHNSGYFADPQNRVQQTPYDVVDTSLSWFSLNDRYMLRLWAKNLNNAFYVEQINPTNFGDNTVAAPPRTFGFTAGYKF